MEKKCWSCRWFIADSADESVGICVKNCGTSVHFDRSKMKFQTDSNTCESHES